MSILDGSLAEMIQASAKRVILPDNFEEIHDEYFSHLKAERSKLGLRPQIDYSDIIKFYKYLESL